MLNVSLGCAHNFAVSAIMSILYQHSCDNNGDFTLKLMLVHSNYDFHAICIWFFHLLLMHVLTLNKV